MLFMLPPFARAREETFVFAHASYELPPRLAGRLVVCGYATCHAFAMPPSRRPAQRTCRQFRLMSTTTK